jgi:hypothetical protein
MIIDLFIILFVSIFAYSLDISSAPKDHYKPCEKNLKIQLLQLGHHFLNIFAQFAWISNDKTILYIYAFTPILVILHWLTNKGHCAVSELVNKYCKIDGYEFRELFNVTEIDKYKHFSTIRYIYILFAWIIAIQKIRNMN